MRRMPSPPASSRGEREGTRAKSAGRVRWAAVFASAASRPYRAPPHLPIASQWVPSSRPPGLRRRVRGGEDEETSGISLDPGTLQILARLGVRLLQRLGCRLLLGGDALDRLVDLVADLRIDRHRAVFHVAGLASQLQHLEIERRHILAVEREHVPEFGAVDDGEPADAGIAWALATHARLPLGRPPLTTSP